MNAGTVTHVVAHQIEFKTQIVGCAVLNLKVDIHAQRIQLFPQRRFHRHVAHTAQALKPLNRRSQFRLTMNVTRLPIHKVIPHLRRQATDDLPRLRTLCAMV